MKKIAIDLDGVVFDSETLFRVYAEVYDVDYHKKDTLVDNSSRLFQKRYNWSEEEFKRFYSENSLEVLENANVMTGAEIVLKKLKENYELIVVTSRSDSEVDISKRKLKDMGLGDITIFNNEHHKIDRLIKERVNYIIDDDETICINASNNDICALFFKNGAQKELYKEGVVNVNNWGEIYKYLNFN